jgi:hypothetical protein
VNRIVSAGEHLAAARVRREDRPSAPLVIQTLKRFGLATLPARARGALLSERGRLGAIAASEDAKEGVAAFREKRARRASRVADRHLPWRPERAHHQPLGACRGARRLRAALLEPLREDPDPSPIGLSMLDAYRSEVRPPVGGPPELVRGRARRRG